MLRWVLYAAVLCTAVAWAGKAAAGGLNRIGGIGPRAGAMGGAYTAIADDASLFYYNPAGLTQFDSPYAEAGGDLLLPRFTYDGRLRGKRHSVARAWHALPLIGYVHPINEDVVAGIGVYVPYGMGAEFEDNPQMLGFHTESLICLTNISPALAFRLTDELSLGLTLDIGYEQFKCQLPFDVAGHYLPVLTDNEGDGWGLGGSVGLLWKTDRISLGARYSTHVKPDISGTTELDIGPFDIHDEFESSCRFPERFQAGVAFRPADRWQLAFDAAWYGYAGDMEELSLKLDKLRITKKKNLDWEDNFSFHAGAAYNLAEDLTLRFGYTYVTAAVPANTVSTITPDANGGNVSVGIEYDRGPMSLAGFVLYAGGERAVGSGLRKEEYSADIVTFGLQAGWSF